jgi:hypothetical protein
MSEGSGRAATKAGRRRSWRIVGVVTPMILVVLVASVGTDANTQRYSVVARLEGGSTANGLTGHLLDSRGNVSFAFTCGCRLRHSVRASVS